MTDSDRGASAAPPPDIRSIGPADLRAALAAGWHDFTRAPGFGLVFSAVYVLGGIFLYLTLLRPGYLVWALPVMVSFPLIAPFAAVGLYEVSRRLEAGQPLDRRAIFGAVLAERNRQMPSMAAVVLFVFLMWVFIGHMIFALFMGLQVMTNVSTSYEVFLTSNGLAMLATGTAVGAVFAYVLFSITIVALPLLLEREVDFVTAMITSWSAVAENRAPLLTWAALIVALLAVGMLPMFLGLFVVLPVLGHATWHLYRRVLSPAAD